MITGTDISSMQSAWKPAPTDSFVFLKVSEGHTYVSPPLHNQAATARRANLVVGFYHFLWPASASVRPEAQAAWFVQNTPCRLGDLLVCDWEPTPGGTAPEAEKDAFIAEVKRLRPGYRVGLYVNASMWRASRKHAGDFLWIAEYGVPSPTIREPWTFWQSSDKTTGQSLDFDHGNFPSKQALKDWAGPTPAPPPPPPPAPPALLGMTHTVGPL